VVWFHMRFINDSQRRAVFARLGAGSHGGIMSNVFSRRSDKVITKEEKKVLDKYGVAFDVDGIDEILLADIPKRDKLRRLENFAKVMVSAEKRHDVSREFQDEAKRAHYNDLAEMFVGGVLDENSTLLHGAKKSSYFRDRVKDLASSVAAYNFDEKIDLAKRAADGNVHLDEIDAYRVMSSGDFDFRKMLGLFNKGVSEDDVRKQMVVTVDSLGEVPTVSYELKTEPLVSGLHIMDASSTDVPLTYDYSIGYYGGEQ